MTKAAGALTVSDMSMKFGVSGSSRVMLSRVLSGLAILLFSIPAFCEITPGRTRISILATSDVHGRLVAHDFSTGSPAGASLSRIATLRNALSKSSDGLITVDAGDFLQGSPLNDLHARRQGHLRNPVIAAMNLVGYDVIVPGNHEFDYGSEYMFAAASQSGARWLAANMKAGDGSSPFQAWTVKTLPGGIRVGIIGFTNPGTPKWEPDANLGGLGFEDIMVSAGKTVPNLKEREDLHMLLAVIHAGIGPRRGHRLYERSDIVMDNIGYKLADRFPDIDAVVMAHTHRRELERAPSGAILVQPGAYASEAAVITAWFSRGPGTEDEASGIFGQEWRLSGTTAEIVAIDDKMTLDPAIERALSPDAAISERMLRRPVATLNSDYEETFNPLADSPALDLIHAAQISAGGLDVSVVSPTFREITLPAGELTVRDLFAFYPYENDLVVLEVGGRDLVALIEEALSMLEENPEGGGYRLNAPHYFFLTFEGVDLQVDPARPKGKRVISATRGGKPLREVDLLRVGVSSYMANRQGPYEVLARARIIGNSGDIRAMVGRELESLSVWKPKATGNFRVFRKK